MNYDSINERVAFGGPFITNVNMGRGMGSQMGDGGEIDDEEGMMGSSINYVVSGVGWVGQNSRFYLVKRQL